MQTNIFDISNPPNIWGEGALFAASGLDGDTQTESGFVLTLGAQVGEFLIHTPIRRLLKITATSLLTVEIVTGDIVFASDSTDGKVLVTFADWHTVVGVLPHDAKVALTEIDANAPSDFLVLVQFDTRFALGYSGETEEDARARAEAVLTIGLRDDLERRLAWYRKLPSVTESADDRLLKKCLSVMKVNTLSAEGAFAQHWSTPDRVPHKDLWLWDSVFHSFAMNAIEPQISWEFLKTVLETQTEEGMIPHQNRTNGWSSTITQPPVLAWGVWENYQVTGDQQALEYALPKLMSYLQWDLIHRDVNGNSLLEWFIEGDVLCRSGESGMDNSPRFDSAVLLDAVDFSVFAALDLNYTAKIAAELGEEEIADDLNNASLAISNQIHELLWDEGDGFYYDRDFDGVLTDARAVSGLLPLLLDDLPPERAALLAAKITDPNWFGTECPLPSIAASDPNFSVNMWRGPMWVCMNYMIVQGLQARGLISEAAQLRDRTIAIVRKYYEDAGVTFEFFDGHDHVHPKDLERKGPAQHPFDLRRKVDTIRDFHWTAALTARLLLDKYA